MTSEQKTRDIWEVANQLEGYVGPDTEERLANFLIREGKEAAKLAERIIELENTRAVPNVPELVRYYLGYAANGPHYTGMVQDKYGDYVRYDQAAAMNAAKDAVIGGLEGALKNERELSAKKSEQIRHWRNAWHEENDKLAQIKVQEPYGYIDGPHFSVEPIEGWIPLYAAPVASDADLRNPSPAELVRRAHCLFKTGDPDAPGMIVDRNGEVALDLCKVCGRGESDLVEDCESKKSASMSDIANDLVCQLRDVILDYCSDHPHLAGHGFSNSLGDICEETVNEFYKSYLVKAASPSTTPITLGYINHRGALGQRTITPNYVYHGSTKWHPEPQWILNAFDHDKNAERDFALISFIGKVVVK